MANVVAYRQHLLAAMVSAIIGEGWRIEISGVASISLDNGGSVYRNGINDRLAAAKMTRLAPAIGWLRNVRQAVAKSWRGYGGGSINVWRNRGAAASAAG